MLVIIDSTFGIAIAGVIQATCRLATSDETVFASIDSDHKSDKIFRGEPKNDSRGDSNDLLAADGYWRYDKGVCRIFPPTLICKKYSFRVHRVDID